MIETRQETQAAINEIQTLTGWSLSEIARKADLSIPAVTRLVKGQTRPAMETRHKLNKLLMRMRRRAVNQAREI